MTLIYFLGILIKQVENNVYEIAVNKESVHKVPPSNINECSIRKAIFNCEVKDSNLGKLYYFYKAELKDSIVYINNMEHLELKLQSISQLEDLKTNVIDIQNYENSITDNSCFPCDIKI